ncbi:MAG: hypothetical protein ACI865_001932 [Flavobacteriaceae bacterium]|jgi:hypothetical protein
MKMNKLTYLLIPSLIVLGACSSDVDTANSDDKQPKHGIDSTEIRPRGDDTVMSSKTEDFENPVDTFNGEWFKINYPFGFTVNPSEPTDVYDDYTFVSTDEASFASPDETVSFFVYSPQWGGDPKNYLYPAPNEKIESDKTTVDEIDPNNIYRWVTFADKDGNYMRSAYSKSTESTHLVFGIKYSDQEIYDLYKESYAAFKKSLVQYAD